MTSNRSSIVGYWILTVLLGLALLAAGAANLMHAEQQVEVVVKNLGYPEYLLTILGVAKIAAGLVILAPGFPRLKEWAYAGIVIDLVGAAASHALAGDPISTAIPPLVIMAVALASYALRPASRRLAG